VSVRRSPPAPLSLIGDATAPAAEERLFNRIGLSGMARRACDVKVFLQGSHRVVCQHGCRQRFPTDNFASTQLQRASAHTHTPLTHRSQWSDHAGSEREQRGQYAPSLLSLWPRPQSLPLQPPVVSLPQGHPAAVLALHDPSLCCAGRRCAQTCKSTSSQAV